MLKSYSSANPVLDTKENKSAGMSAVLQNSPWIVKYTKNFWIALDFCLTSAVSLISCFFLWDYNNTNKSGYLWIRTRTRPLSSASSAVNFFKSEQTPLLVISPNFKLFMQIINFILYPSDKAIFILHYLWAYLHIFKQIPRMLLLKDGSDSINLEGYTAIVPSIGVGNAGQLACDLIISTLKLKRIGNIWHPALIPITGPSAFQHDPHTKAASCEVYTDELKKVLAIQLRSPLISVHLNDFHEMLVNVLQKCSRVIILASSFGYEKHTIEASPFEYIANEEFKQTHADRLGALQWNEFSGEVVHGGGNAVKLFKALDTSKVPSLLLFKYVLEGDNSMDASQLVKELDDLLESELKMKSGNGLKLAVPVSWKLLYGNEVGDLIF